MVMFLKSGKARECVISFHVEILFQAIADGKLYNNVWLAQRMLQ